MRLKTLVYRIVGSGLPVLSALRLGPHADAVGIVMVHGVYPRAEINGLPMPQSSVQLKALETNLLGLGRTYSFVGIDDVVAMLAGTVPFRKCCLALTFDDSLKCHHDVVAPKLVQWGIPAVFYISTDTIQTRRPYWWLRLEYALSRINGSAISVTLPGGECLTLGAAQAPALRRKITTALRTSSKPSQCEKAIESIESQVGVEANDVNHAYPYAEPLGWDDVRALAKNGFTIGSHTLSHPNLTLLDAEELEAELKRSRQTIEQEVRTACRHLCYPHGFYSNAVCAAARAAGYLSAVTTHSPGWNRRGQDPFRLERFGLPAAPYKLPFLLTGAGDVFSSLKRIAGKHESN